MTGLTDQRADLLVRVRERLASESADPTPQVMADAIRAESGGVLGDTDLLEALRFLQTELVGAGRLEELLADPDVADILVVGPDQVWVDRGIGLRRSDVRFTDDAAVRRLAVRLALGAGKRLDDAAPWVDGQLTQRRPPRIQRPTARGDPADQRRRDVPVAAGAPAGDTAPRRPGRPWRHPAGDRRDHVVDHRRPAGVPDRRRHRRGQDDHAVGDAGAVDPAERIVLCRGRRRARAGPSARRPTGRADRERRGRRRGPGARPGPAGPADATRPDRRRRGARRRGRRPAHRPQHRSRGMCRDAARELDHRGARTHGGARRSRRAWTAPRCTASSPPRSTSSSASRATPTGAAGCRRSASSRVAPTDWSGSRRSGCGTTASPTLAPTSTDSSRPGRRGRCRNRARDEPPAGRRGRDAAPVAAGPSDGASADDGWSGRWAPRSCRVRRCSSPWRHAPRSSWWSGPRRPSPRASRR